MNIKHVSILKKTVWPIRNLDWEYVYYIVLHDIFIHYVTDYLYITRLLKKAEVPIATDRKSPKLAGF